MVAVAVGVAVAVAVAVGVGCGHEQGVPPRGQFFLQLVAIGARLLDLLAKPLDPSCHDIKIGDQQVVQDRYAEVLRDLQQAVGAAPAPAVQEEGRYQIAPHFYNQKRGDLKGQDIRGATFEQCMSLPKQGG